jgi:hypothetical protein
MKKMKSAPKLKEIKNTVVRMKNKQKRLQANQNL